MKPQRALTSIAAIMLVATLGACSSLSGTVAGASTQAASPTSSEAGSADPSADSSSEPATDSATDSASASESKKPADDESSSAATEQQSEPAEPETSEPTSSSGAAEKSGRRGSAVPDITNTKAYEAVDAISKRLLDATTIEEAKAAVGATFCTWEYKESDEFGPLYYCLSVPGKNDFGLYVYDTPDFDRVALDAGAKLKLKLAAAYTERFLVIGDPSTFAYLVTASKTAGA